MFTSGGFPARYGNALSGVLSMESQNIPSNNTLQANLGTFGGSLGVNWQAVPDVFGIRFSGNRTDTRLFMAMNGLLGEFPAPPSSYDLNISAVWKYSGTGKIKLFNYLTNDNLAVKLHRPLASADVERVYANTALNRIHSLQWTDVLDEWIVKANISWNSFRAERTIKDAFHLTLKPQDNTYKFRVDIEKELSDNVRVLFGQEVESSEYKNVGQKIISSTTNNGNEVYDFSSAANANRWGGYAEIEAKVARQILVGAGVRTDHHTLAAQTTFDPRLSVRYSIDEFWNLRASWGVYHQFAGLDRYDALTGNARLQAQQAQHYILGVDYQQGDWLFRVEGYNKLYENLVLPSATKNYDNLGNGYARGVDVFLKYGAYLVTPFSGWVSYSYLNTQRLQTRNTVSGVVYEAAPAPFDLTHSLTIVYKHEIVRHLSGGCTFRYSTGAPHTPIIGSIKNGDGSYQAFEGAVGSERLAEAVRLDVSLSYFYPFSDTGNLVIFASVNNITNYIRPLGWDYSDDFSQRAPRQSTARRTFVMGANLSLTF